MNNDDALLYLKRLSSNQIQLQVVYSELNLSHRFIRFEISNTNSYYKSDLKSMNDMIKQYLSKDPGNISFKLQDDRQALKESKKNANSMVDKLLKEMMDNGLFNSENKNKISYTIAIVYDYNRNNMYRKLFEEFKENNTKKSNSFINFKIVNEDKILNERDQLEGVLSRWAIDFFEYFKELFIYYEDNIDGDNFGINNEKVKRPRFLELRPIIFK